MRALRLDKFGPARDLAVSEVANPRAAAGEVLVQVRAAAVNPLDWKNAAGMVSETVLPRIPGRDFAGVVVAGAEEWIGRAVWGMGGGGMGITRDGSHAELLAVPVAGVREKPARLSFEEAAAIGVAYTAAWRGLATAARLERGEVLLVVGSSGAVGRAAIEIAQARGARVIGADRVAGGDAAPDDFVDVTGQNLPERVKALTGGRGADAAFDAVGGASFEATLQSLRPGGRCAVISSVGERRVSLDLIDFYHQELTLVGVDTLKLDAASAGGVLDELRPGFESGRLTPPKLQMFPLAQAAAAYAAVQSGSRDGKVVLIT